MQEGIRKSIFLHGKGGALTRSERASKPLRIKTIGQTNNDSTYD